MSTTPANPNIEALRANVRSSLVALDKLIDGPLAQVDTSKLYRPPAENEWTIMQNLAHIVEFMPYWAGEIEKVVAKPGCTFGRTSDDEGRLQGISERELDSLEHIKAALPGSYARIDEVMGKLKDSDLELTGKHVRYGEKSVGWILEDVIRYHIRGHMEQIKRCMVQYKTEQENS